MVSRSKERRTTLEVPRSQATCSFSRACGFVVRGNEPAAILVSNSVSVEVDSGGSAIL